MTEDHDRSSEPDGVESPRSVPSLAPPATQTRRRLLSHLAAGGAVGLAGCGQFASSGGPGTTPTDTGTEPEIVDQTLRIPTDNDPKKTTFFGRHSLNRFLTQTFAMRVLENASLDLQRIVWETGTWPEGLFVGAGDVHYTWIEEPIKITPRKVTVTIRDGAKWSDGHPITATDIACLELQQIIRNAYPPFYAEGGDDQPGNVWAAIDDFELTDRSVTYRSSAGHFQTFWDVHIKNQLGTYLGPHHVPTHLEPYASYVEAVIDTVERAQAGEIDPWKGHDDPRIEPDAPTKKSLIERHLADVSHLEKFSKPENVVSTGAWNLVEMEGTEFVFAPNEHHRNTGDVNFERMVAEFTQSDRRRNAALKAGRLDFASSAFSAAVSPTVVDSFPAEIRELLVPGNQFTGNEMAINFDHAGLDHRPVRAAIMYAIDHEAVAGNIHPTAAPPVTTPGGDCWDATRYVGADWIDENLTTYETDRSRAADLMEQAGFSRPDGQWVGPHGDAVTLPIATTADTPRWEPTVASQLEEFGIRSEVRTLESGTFSQRVDAGEIPAWPSSLNSLTNLAPYTLFVWLSAAANHRKYGIFPEEQFAEGRFYQGTPVPQSEERYRAFSVRAPPVGEPDGELREYTPAASSLFFQSNPPESEFRRRIETGIWLANWFLPTIPLTRKREQFFIDDAHWKWPTDTAWWQSFENGSAALEGSLFGQGTIRANPDNPEGETPAE